MLTELVELDRQPKFRRLAPSTLRAAWWAARAVRGVRKDLVALGVHAVVPPPPDVAWGARTGVDGVLHRLEPNCIERGLVLQAWLHSHGVDRDVVVGVRVGARDAVNAHAWVDGVRDIDALLYTEIHRIAPGRGEARSGESLGAD